MRSRIYTSAHIFAALQNLLMKEVCSTVAKPFPNKLEWHSKLKQASSVASNAATAQSRLRAVAAVRNVKDANAHVQPDDKTVSREIMMKKTATITILCRIDPAHSLMLTELVQAQS